MFHHLGKLRLSCLLLILSGAARAQPPAASGPYFPLDSVWNHDITNAPVDPESAAAIQFLDNAGGWGNGNVFQIDFSIEAMAADESAPFRDLVPNPDYYSPDCDLASVPLPAGGAIEGQNDYSCNIASEDCHLIVAHQPSNTLYELYRTTVTGDQVFSTCLVRWNMALTYPLNGRGEQCTSADAAGFPIAPLLFSADEVVAGSIDHAVRFILPNPRMRAGIYVHPATHVGGPSGAAQAPPYGARFRLRADFPLASLPNESARVVAEALQRYGMLLADGGQIALTAQSDRFSVAKWNGLLGPHDLSLLQVTDFEMVAAGERIAITYDCDRTHPLFLDGFELGDPSKWMP